MSSQDADFINANGAEVQVVAALFTTYSWDNNVIFKVSNPSNLKQLGRWAQERVKKGENTLNVSVNDSGLADIVKYHANSVTSCL